jgi:general secretion pathway protein G
VSLKSAIQLYFHTTGEIPSTEQGFQALIERPERLAVDKPWQQILDRSLDDSWGNPYKYRSFGGDPPKFEIRGLGPDGIYSDDDYIATFTVDK